MRSKKSELSMQIIILAVIGLVVMSVLIYIFLSRAGIFGANVGGTCLQQGGGACIKEGGSCGEGKIKQITSCSKIDLNCDKDTKQCTCCVPIQK